VADLKANRKTTTKAAALKKAPAKKATAGLRTKSGAVLTPEAEAALLAEAESGYDPGELIPRKAAGRPSLSPTGGISHRISKRSRR
jgi:hypothetical protein